MKSFLFLLIFCFSTKTCASSGSSDFFLEDDVLSDGQTLRSSDMDFATLLSRGLDEGFQGVSSASQPLNMGGNTDLLFPISMLQQPLSSDPLPVSQPEESRKRSYAQLIEGGIIPFPRSVPLSVTQEIEPPSKKFKHLVKVDERRVKPKEKLQEERTKPKLQDHTYSKKYPFTDEHIHFLGQFLKEKVEAKSKATMKELHTAFTSQYFDLPLTSFTTWGYKAQYAYGLVSAFQATPITKVTDEVESFLYELICRNPSMKNEEIYKAYYRKFSKSDKQLVLRKRIGFYGTTMRYGVNWQAEHSLLG